MIDDFWPELIGPRPIRAAYLIRRAGLVACHQFDLLDRMDVLEPLEPGGVFLLNAPHDADAVWQQLPREVQSALIDRRARFYVIDAAAVARGAGLGTRINTIMQACFFAITGIVPRDEAIAQIHDSVEATYRKAGPTVVAQNRTAVDMALSHLHEVPVPAAVTATRSRPPIVASAAPDFVQRVTAVMMAGKGDALPAIDALALFYDFRELTPIGRRGDEMIRRLIDRLVAVDLLDQAAELLQHQVDQRLDGVAKASVAARLAVIYLMNHKPAKAQAVLRATRTADLSNEIRVPRLMIEARALSDLGRHDFALEVVAGLEGRESLRLRSDIYWASRNWQKAAEHIELLYGDRWKSFEPLSDAERADMLRVGVGYALAEDKLGAARLRDKYAAKMAEGPDGRAFDVVTGGLGSSSPEFREVARLVAAGDTLSGFLRDLKARYPEMHGVLPEAAGPGANAPKPKADPEPTGSIRQKAPRRVSAR
jgi:Pyruvate/2-oxoacid:ferredoxin oxidoreductase gamma subunit